MVAIGIGWGWEIGTVMSPRRQEDTVVVMVVVVDGMNRIRMTGEDGGRVGADGIIARGSLVLCHRGIGGEGFEALSCRREGSPYANRLGEVRIGLVHVGYREISCWVEVMRYKTFH
jgi:hypothetical protein